MPYYRRRRPPRRPYPNRNAGGSIFGVIIAFIIIINVLGAGIGLLAPILPILIVIFIIYQLTKNNRSTTSSTKTYTSKKKSTTMSNRQKMNIDERLGTYFKDNYRLQVFDDIYLSPKGGNYKTFDDLVINKGEEYIMTLKEFGDRYPSTYDELVSLLSTFASQSSEKTEVKTPKSETKRLSKAQEFIEAIDSLNVDIQKEEIKSGLYQTCALLKQIDIAQEDDDDKIRKLYEYYLPILVKILENYKTLSKVSKDSSDFKASEDQLIKTIVLINEALKTINESIHEDDYMDLSADISTLQSLLKKDGLVKAGTIYEGDEDDKAKQ